MHGVRKHERYSQRGKEGGGREKNCKTISYTSYSNKQVTDTKRMAKRKKIQGAEIRKKRLVMSMLSVTSFVDSHHVSMTTVKSHWESDIRH